MTGVLLRHCPPTYRLAWGLCGRDDMAAAVVARVLGRATVLASRWASDDAADRWFLRFTVLAAREVASVGGGGVAAGLEWLRSLAGQQREAIVLRHGLGLDLHQVAAAMDCSSAAATNHLVAATAALKDLGPIQTWTADLPAQLAAVVPPPVVVSAHVARAVARRRWRMLARRFGIAIGATSIAAAVAWAALHLWRALLF